MSDKVRKLRDAAEAVVKEIRCNCSLCKDLVAAISDFDAQPEAESLVPTNQCSVCKKPVEDGQHIHRIVAGFGNPGSVHHGACCPEKDDWSFMVFSMDR